MSEDAAEDLAGQTILVADDDATFRNRLGRAMNARGLNVLSAESVHEALGHISTSPPGLAVIDLRLNDGSGLDIVDALLKARPDARAVVLTGYGNIATAVAAVKFGAIDYMSKPADADDVLHALLKPGTSKPDLPENLMSAVRVRWEHINRIYEMCGQNVSETARRLGMHRRTLQRILSKHSPK
jgi:two-component system response regulator RegA